MSLLELKKKLLNEKNEINEKRFKKPENPYARLEERINHQAETPTGKLIRNPYTQLLEPESLSDMRRNIWDLAIILADKKRKGKLRNTK